MIFPNSKFEIKQVVSELVKEITPHIEDGGKINIHVNQVFIAGHKEEDWVRQSFIFYVLCKIQFLFPDLVESDVTEKIAIYIKNNYETNLLLNETEKSFIELYTVRASFFVKKDIEVYKNGLLKKSIGILGTTPILLHLLLAVEADSLKYTKLSFIQQHTLDIAKEAVYFSMKSNQRDVNMAYQYTDIFYYDSLLQTGFIQEAQRIVEEKMKKDESNRDKIFTSVLAKLFEGWTAVHTEDKSALKVLFENCMERRIKLTPYLIREFNYTPNSLSEVRFTSYVCLDSYAHLLLGITNLYERYE